ncbi:hypothetical protein [Caballeronia sp. J97]|uniref:hypothetical protein n=1 Tax=Caballeronia sp. J97 TaxID=2805429 RepID=UPI002AB30EE2|nr:hypothetical protein [Caballeronia sp. J97]
MTNVAPGIKGTDAVNMNQLNAVQSSVNTVACIASAMTMPNMAPSKPGETVVAAGVANYKRYTAGCRSGCDLSFEQQSLARERCGVHHAERRQRVRGQVA